jgi:hypothetical protein
MWCASLEIPGASIADRVRFIVYGERPKVSPYRVGLARSSAV